MTIDKEPLCPGDPVRVRKLVMMDGSVTEVELPATVRYAVHRSVAVAYADGTSEVVEPQYVIDARKS